MRDFAGGHNHQQPNDPVKLAQAILTVAAAEKPPVRLPLGPDAVRRIEEKHTFVNAELATWRTLADSTAFVV